MYGKILLVGTVSNVAKTIDKELKIVFKALSIFDSVDIFLVESDSNDATTISLNNTKFSNLNFQFMSFGTLRGKYPNRIERIAFCRNVYVKYIQANYKKNKWDYIAVADLDGMNLNLSKKAIKSCFEFNTKWDGMMANQKFGYYDIYALRAKEWVEEDCFLAMSHARKIKPKPKLFTFSFLNFIIQFIHFDKLRQTYIYDKMKILKLNSDLIRVQSAFGGFAIYRPYVFVGQYYKTSDLVESEHVYFHRTGNNRNRNFYINPRLINNYMNTYNINRLTIIRFLRELKKYLNLV